MKIDWNTVASVVVGMAIYGLADQLFLKKMREKITANFETDPE